MTHNMTQKATFSEIVARLVEVLSSEEMAQEYNSDGIMHEGVCGWCGVMAPITRAAFIHDFGFAATAAAEAKARQEIKEREARHNMTQYHAHTIEADNLQGVPAVGGFFWADNSGLKCDDGRGVFGEVATLLQFTDYADEYDRREHEKKPARLCQVREVYTVSPEDFNRPELADELTAKHQPEGGSASDDIEDGASWYDLTDEQRATLYTFGALVTDGRRFFLIDSEGYNYPRYIYTPKNWRENLADIVAAERQSIEDEKARQAQQEAEEKAARLADYRARCQKWAHLMEDVRPLEDKERKAWEIYTRSGYGKGTPEAKAHTTAKRATDNARKRNILAMCSAAFPGVKFSASVHRGWGSDFCLSWADGPTAEEFEAATDLDLFRSSWETFCGYDDSTDIMHAEFTEFSSLTMGSNSGDVRAERNMSQEARADILAAIFEAVPAYDTKTARGYYDDVTVTAEQAHAVAERLGLAESDIYFWGPCVRDCYTMSADQLVHRAWLATSYTATAPTEPTAPTEGGKAQDMAEDAPAEGLQLIETVEGVAVVGDSRTTYANRKAIKAHGATWNKAAQRWEAVAPEAVEALRRWFGAPAPMECAELEAVEIQPDGVALSEIAEACEHLGAVIEKMKDTTADSERNAKRAEVLALLAEQWREKPEYMKKAGECQVREARPEETAEALACEVVAIVAAYQADHGAPDNYAKACKLRTWFDQHPAPAPMECAELEAVEIQQNEPAPEPSPVFDEGEEIAKTRDEARERGAYWVGLMWCNVTGKGSREFIPICEELGNHPARLLARLQDMQQRGEIANLYTRDDFHGVTIRYTAGKIYKELFLETLPEDIRPEYRQEIEELREWGDLVTDQRRTA